MYLYNHYGKIMSQNAVYFRPILRSIYLLSRTLRKFFIAHDFFFSNLVKNWMLIECSRNTLRLVATSKLSTKIMLSFRDNIKYMDHYFPSSPYIITNHQSLVIISRLDFFLHGLPAIPGRYILKPPIFYTGRKRQFKTFTYTIKYLT